MSVPPAVMRSSSGQSRSASKCLCIMLSALFLLCMGGFGLYVGVVDPSILDKIRAAINGNESQANLAPTSAPTAPAPTTVQCAAGCSTTMRGNGMCDAACFNSACGLDDGDCDDVETGSKFLRTIYLGSNTDIPANVKQAVNDAVDRWNAILVTQVTGPGTPSMFADISVGTSSATNRNFFLSNCFPNQVDVNDMALETVRGLLVSLELDHIDGVGSILGQTSVCAISKNGARGGLLTFDIADLESLAERNQLDAVMLHELGHAIGLGTLWEEVGLRNDDNTGYTGTHALSAYQALDADFSSATTVPLEQEGGAGTAFVHWENLDSAGGLCDEVMTGSIKSTTGDARLSGVSIEALRDLGHSVDDSSEGTLPTIGELCLGVSSNEVPEDVVDLRGDVSVLDNVAVFDPETGTMTNVATNNSKRRLLAASKRTGTKGQIEPVQVGSGGGGLRGGQV